MVPIPIALVGCGGISWVHVRGILNQPTLVRLAAVCDTDDAKAKEKAVSLGVPARCWDEILKDESIPAVDICLPHHLHRPFTIEALDAAKHVLVEKPFATTLDDADAMIDAADRRQRILMIAHCERFEPQYQSMHQLVEKGAIGEITMARADHQQHVRLPPEHWLCDPARAGGGVIIGSGVHRIDLLRWFCGDITEVYCATKPIAGRLDSQMEVNALALFRHGGGAISQCAFNWNSYDNPWYELLILYGTQGQMHNVGGVHVARSTEPGPAAFERHGVNPFTNGFENEIIHFAECIRDGTEPLTSGRRNRNTLAAVLACYESARTRQPAQPR